MPRRPGYLFIAPWEVTDVGGVNQVILNLSRLMREGDTYAPKIIVTSWSGAESSVNLRNGVPMSRMRLRPPLHVGRPGAIGDQMGRDAGARPDQARALPAQ